MSDLRAQQDRVLAALQAAGPRGITAVDFDLPNVIDGGKPIQRVAARIDELKNRHGHSIEVAGRRNRCAVYVLVSSLEEGAGTTPAAPAPSSNAEPPQGWNHCGACGKRVKRFRTGYNGTQLAVDSPHAPDGWSGWSLVDFTGWIAVNHDGKATVAQDQADARQLAQRGCTFHKPHRCGAVREVAA